MKKALEKSKKVRLVVTLEENTTLGGLGEGIVHILAQNGIRTPALLMGAPDAFVEHARISQQRRICGLSVEEISARVLDALAENNGGAQ